MTLGLFLAVVLSAPLRTSGVQLLEDIPTPTDLLSAYSSNTGKDSLLAQANQGIRRFLALSEREQRRSIEMYVDLAGKALVNRVPPQPLPPLYDLGRLDVISIAEGRGSALGPSLNGAFLRQSPSRPGLAVTPGFIPPETGPYNVIPFLNARRLPEVSAAVRAGYFDWPAAGSGSNAAFVTLMKLPTPADLAALESANGEESGLPAAVRRCLPLPANECTDATFLALVGCLSGFSKGDLAGAVALAERYFEREAIAMPGGRARANHVASQVWTALLCVFQRQGQGLPPWFQLSAFRDPSVVRTVSIVLSKARGAFTRVPSPAESWRRYSKGAPIWGRRIFVVEASTGS